MKTKLKYVADDGTEWDGEDKAVERNRLLVVIEEITKACLKPVPKDGNWKGYVQQYPAAVLDYKRTLMRLAKQCGVYGGGGKGCIWDSDPKEVHAHSIAGRFIDDCSIRPLQMAWNRLMCMDDQCREYNQPYYAMHPDKAEGGEVITNAQA